jgi:hypothetical protein
LRYAMPMRTVYEAANLIDAHLIRQAIEAEGIPAFVRGEALTGAIGELGVFGLIGVMVPEAAWPQARSIVETLQRDLERQTVEDAMQTEAGAAPAGLQPV